MKNFLLLIALLIISSCQKDITLDVPEGSNQPVVNCFFNSDSTWKVQVSQSQYILDNDTITLISNAAVSVQEENGAAITLTLDGKGNYVSADKPVQGKKYTLKVNIPGFDENAATDIIPSPSTILSADTSRVTLQGFNYMEVSSTLNDNPAETNYYNLQLTGYYYQYEYDPVTFDIIDSFEVATPIYFSSTDVIFESETALQDGNSAYFTDNLFNGNNYTIKVQVDAALFNRDEFFGFPLYHHIDINLKTVSKEYYRYSVSFKRNQYTASDPFAQPVQVYTNVTNGYGIFSGYSNSAYKMEIK